MEEGSPVHFREPSLSIIGSWLVEQPSSTGDRCPSLKHSPFRLSLESGRARPTLLPGENSLGRNRFRVFGSGR